MHFSRLLAGVKERSWAKWPDDDEVHTNSSGDGAEWAGGQWNGNSGGSLRTWILQIDKKSPPGRSQQVRGTYKSADRH